MKNIEELAKIAFDVYNNAEYVWLGFSSDGQSTWDAETEQQQERFKKMVAVLIPVILNDLKFTLFTVDDNGNLEVLKTPEDLKRQLEYLNLHQPKNYKKSEISLTDITQLGGMTFRAIDGYSSREERALTNLKNFQNDMLTYLRAMALIAESVGNADTHAEKDARLRGMVSILETAIQEVRSSWVNLLDHTWSTYPDLFKSDYPVRPFREKINDLTFKLKKANEKLEKLNPGESQTDEDDKFF